MAPRKPTTTAKPARESTASPNKVVKRPARGYHRYKNGLLNVAPKGGEIEWVKNNSNSPLLRLPPEVRNRIWEYTLGNIVFKAQTVSVPRKMPQTILTPPPDETGIGVALLRTCRQIYSETASLPFRLNAMAFDSIWQLERGAKRFKCYQRKQFTTLRIEVDSIAAVSTTFSLRDIHRMVRIRPAMKCIQVVVFSTSAQTNKDALKEAEVRLRHDFGLYLKDRVIQVTIKGCDQQLPDPGHCFKLSEPTARDMAPYRPVKRIDITISNHDTSCKVVKRPSRGYHKFRSGILNVAPKGEEKQLVKANQQASLLRLPPEIRDHIWKYALRDKVFLAKHMFIRPSLRPLESRFMPSATDPTNGVALIRSCRQIYSETALYPYLLGTFACANIWALRQAAQTIEHYQRKQVVHVRLVCPNLGRYEWIRDGWFKYNKVSLRNIFPTIKDIEVVIHQVSENQGDEFRMAANRIREALRRTLEEAQCVLTVRGTPGEMELMESYFDSEEQYLNSLSTTRRLQMMRTGCRRIPYGRRWRTDGGRFGY
ncbi:hypothetical protein OPT61_g5473 [Boeremia exigua]|uniref:Uncharacterized protein n=1 Tax=Boeremia exigua TaxID=749465 RepID=A0ACC2IA75_9PLEO|nr:hypothetical protein OPT61_g5473 [Boeremia exigua]